VITFLHYPPLGRIETRISFSIALYRIGASSHAGSDCLCFFLKSPPFYLMTHREWRKNLTYIFGASNGYSFFTPFVCSAVSPSRPRPSPSLPFSCHSDFMHQEEVARKKRGFSWLYLFWPTYIPFPSSNASTYHGLVNLAVVRPRR